MLTWPIITFLPGGLSSFPHSYHPEMAPIAPQKWLLTPLPSLAYHFHCSGILVKVFAFHLITCVYRVSVPTHFLCEIDYSLLGVVRCVCKCPVVAYTYVLQPKDPLT